MGGVQSAAMTAPQLMRGVLAALADPRTFAKGCVMAHSAAAWPAGKAPEAGGSHSQDGGHSSDVDGNDSADGRGGSDDPPLPPPPSLTAFRKHFDTVFVDSSGWLNLMADVPRSSLHHVRHLTSTTHPSHCSPHTCSFPLWAAAL